MRLFKISISVFIAAFFVSGCSTTMPFKLAPSLVKETVTLENSSYIPLARLADVYRLECDWDSVTHIVTISKGQNRIVMCPGGRIVLINGVERRLDKPVILTNGAIYVPVSFAQSSIGPFIGSMNGEGMIIPELPKKFTIDTIVLDPGHGGKDAGALGRRLRTREKDMALDFARRIKALLENSGIRVVMTRDNDTFIPLPRRAEIANKSGMDLFVSVHINASPTRSLKGFECYYLSEATDDNARALEAVENASLEMSDTAMVEHSRGLDKTLWDLVLTENRAESADLASCICDSVDASRTIASRGVKSARFFVLKNSHIPAILIEMGYLTNRSDETKLKEDAVRDTIARAIVDGIMRYKKEYERTEGFTRP